MPTKNKTTKKEPTKKKTVTKKTAAEKKTTAKVKKSGTKPVQAKKVSAKTAEVKTVTKSAEITEKTPKIEQKKKTVEISKFFYGVVIFIIILLYAQIFAGAVFYYKYDIQVKNHGEIVHQLRKRPLTRTRKKGIRTIRRRQPKTTKQQQSTQTEKKAYPALKCPPPVKRDVVFDEREYLPYAKEGNAVIEGDLCLTLKDGSLKCFENAEVFINPVTSYSDEWYKRGWAGRETLEVAHPRAFHYNKKVKTGKDGAFRFEKLPAGSYYVASAICVPEAKGATSCQYHRYATKVEIKKYVKPKLKRVYP